MEQSSRSILSIVYMLLYGTLFIQSPLFMFLLKFCSYINLLDFIHNEFYFRKIFIFLSIVFNFDSDIGFRLKSKLTSRRECLKIYTIQVSLHMLSWNDHRNVDSKQAIQYMISYKMHFTNRSAQIFTATGAGRRQSELVPVTSPEVTINCVTAVPEIYMQCRLHLYLTRRTNMSGQKSHSLGDQGGTRLLSRREPNKRTPTPRLLMVLQDFQHGYTDGKCKYEIEYLYPCHLYHILDHSLKSSQ